MLYRLIHLLRIHYEHDGPGKCEIIVHLNSDGTHRFKGGVRARPPKHRIVALRVDDEMLVEGTAVEHVGDHPPSSGDDK